MRIAVLGGGHGAYAAAADLAEKGHETVLWRRDAAALKPVLDAGSIQLTDAEGTRDVAVAATAEIGKAVSGAGMILMPGPAQAQADIAAAMAPHLSDGQAILLPPGSFGTFLVSETVRSRGCRAALVLGESGTLPYLTRKQGERQVAIVTRATRLPTGVYPYDRANDGFGIFEAAYPAIERLTDGLDGALMNAGPIIHPPLILMNAGPIQHFDHWDIHNEGTQPAIRSVTDALDAERIAVREAFGYGAPHFPLTDHYDPEREEWMYGQAAHDRLVVSNKWRERLDLHRHRYMREDVQIGLSLIVSAGAAGVATPVAVGLLSIAGAILGEDLYATGRTFESLGLSGLSVAEIRRLMQEGRA